MESLAMATDWVFRHEGFGQMQAKECRLFEAELKEGSKK